MTKLIYKTKKDAVGFAKLNILKKYYDSKYYKTYKKDVKDVDFLVKEGSVYCGCGQTESVNVYLDTVKKQYHSRTAICRVCGD